MEFIRRVYIDPEKTYGEIEGVGIQDLMLSEEFFLFETNMIQPVWNEIWYRLLQKSKNLKIVNRSIAESLKKYLANNKYLAEFNIWIQKFVFAQPHTIKELLKHGLAKDILEILSNTHDENSAFTLFQIANLLISHCDSSKIDINSIFSIVIHQVLLTTKYKDICRPLIVKLLQFKIGKTFSMFLDFCSSQTQPEIIQCLIDSLYTVLTDVSMKNYVNSSRFEGKIFYSLSKILPRTWENEEFVIDVWEKFGNCVGIVFDEVNAKENGRESLKIWPLLKLFRSENYESVREKIVERTIENFLSVLVNKNTDLVKFPEIIPLFVDFLCFFHDGLSKERQNRIAKVLQIQINLQIFAQNGLSSVILYHLSMINGVAQWKGCEILFSRAISECFKVSELKKMVDIIKSFKEDKQKKIHLLKIMESALQPQIHRNNRKKYYLFNGNIGVSKPYKADFYTLKEENSLIFWIFPETYQKCTIITLKCVHESIQIQLSSCHLIIQIKEITLETKQALKEFTWNLVTINLNLNVLKNIKISAYINLNLAEFKEKKQVKMSKKNSLSNIQIGGFEGDFFKGKISDAYLFKKNIDEEGVRWLFHFPPEYTDLHFTQDFKNSLVLNITEDVIENVRVCEGIYSMLNIGIHAVIKTYGYVRMMIELVEVCNDSESLFGLYGVVHQIIKEFSVEENGQREFVRFFADIVVSKEINLDICKRYLGIIEACRGDIVRNLLDNLLYQENLLALAKNCNLFKVVLEKYKFYRAFGVENFFQYCLLVSGLPDIDTIRHLKFYLGDDPDGKYKDCLANAIVSLADAEHPDIILCLLEVISAYSYDYSNLSQLSTALLYVLEQMRKNVKVQIKVLKILILENKFIGNNGENLVIETYINVIDNFLPDLLEKEIVIFLLQEGFLQNPNTQKIRNLLVDIVLKRMKFFSDKSIQDEIISAIQKNKNKIIEYIFHRNIFPSWLDEYYRNSADSAMALELVHFLFVLEFSQNSFEFFRMFLETRTEVKIYTSLLEKIVESEYIENYLQIFYVFKRKEFLLDFESFDQCFEVLMQSNSFMKKVADSAAKLNFNENFYHKIKSAPEKKPLIVIYVEFLLFGLDLGRRSERDFKYFKLFLQHPEILFFSRYPKSSPDLVNIENFLAIQALSSLLSFYYQNTLSFKSELFEYIGAVSVFEKLHDFVANKKNKEIIFDALCTLLYSRPTENAEFNKNDLENSMKLKYKQFVEAQEQFYNIYINKTIAIDKMLISDEWIQHNDIISGMIEKITFYEYSEFHSRSSDFSVAHNKQLASTYENFRMMHDEFMQSEWLKLYLEDIDRYKYKQRSDFKKVFKRLFAMYGLLQDPQPSQVKVRQVYDKFYRWAFFKPFYPSEDPISQPVQRLTYSIAPLDNNYDSKSIYSRFSSSNFSKDSVLSSQSTKVGQPGFIFPVERIKIQYSYFGTLHITSTNLEICFKGEEKPYEAYPGSALKCNMVKKELRHVWYIYEISEVIPRRFIHQHTAVEVVLKSGRSYFLNLFTKDARDDVLKAVKKWGIVKVTVKRPVAEIEQVTNDWKSGKIGNFEYLMLVNRYGGRSNNDLSQYPVFPWVVKEYKKNILLYEDTEIYRNFKFPVGAQTESTRALLLQKFANWKEPDMSAFHFGSHYSNSGVVLHFLLRIEPYSTQHKMLQGGKFDVADRLFISVESAWDSCSGVSGDVKELVPELFFNPFIFNSYSDRIYGINEFSSEVIHAKPPGWAVSNWDFIIKHRICLESPAVSRELHNWIDLIFGYKQHSKMGEAGFNIFHSITYEKPFNTFLAEHSENMSGIIDQVCLFGQTPINVFKKKAHPARDELAKTYSFHKFFYCNEDHDLIFKKGQKIESKLGKAYAAYYFEDSILTVKTIGNKLFVTRYKFKEHIETPIMFSESPLQHYTKSQELEQPIADLNFSYAYLQVVYTSNTFAVFCNKYVVSGLDSSKCLMVHNFKGELIGALLHHTELITVVSSTPDYILSAGLDSTIKSWKSINDMFIENTQYFGHDSPVMHLKTIDSYQVVISGSLQGLVLVHDIRTGDCLSKIDENIIGLDTNEIGFIGLCTSEKIKFFGLNGDFIREHAVYNLVNCVKFSVCGDFFIEAYEKFVIFRDIMRPEVEHVIEISAVSELVVHPSEKTLYFFVNLLDTAEHSVNLYRLSSLKQLKLQQTIIDEFR